MSEQPLAPLLARVADLLAADDEIVIAIAFGSVAADQARADSDFDIAVLTRTPLDATRKQDLIEKLETLRRCVERIVDRRPPTAEALKNGRS